MKNLFLVALIFITSSCSRGHIDIVLVEKTRNVSCSPNELLLNGLCMKSEMTRECQTRPLNTTGGLEKSLDGGLSYGQCLNYTCAPGYEDVGGSCEKIFTCPANYLMIKENNRLGVKKFCVMRDEARDEGGNPVSSQSGLPWVSLTITEAKSKCVSLGEDYDLISNPEWLAIANEIESNPSNWSSGVVGSGKLAVGHTDYDPYLLSREENSSYFKTKNNANNGWDQRRNLFLESGEEIWDFSGNAWEWVDYSLGGALDAANSKCGPQWREFYHINLGCGVNGLAEIDYMPLNPAGINSWDYGANYNLGRIYGQNNLSEGYLLRGGAFTAGQDSGIYSLALDADAHSGANNIGFRCVFRQKQ